MQYSSSSSLSAATAKQEIKNARQTSTSLRSQYGFSALVLLALSNGANGFAGSSPLPNTPDISAFATTLSTKRLELRKNSYRSLDTSLGYASVVGPPMPASVRKGLEDLAAGTGSQGEKQVHSSKVRGNNIVTVHTLEDFKEEVGNERDRMVVVRFFAPWCKACMAVSPSFYKLAKTYPDVKIVEVPISPQNSNLHQGLGVPSIPFGHIYHPEAGLVEELKMTRREFSVFEKTLNSYVEGSCKLSGVGDCVDPHPRKEVVTKADKIAIK